MSAAFTRRLALWSGPRNLSTALMRAFSSRADCVVSDEPFYASYLSDNHLDHPGREAVIASQPNDWRVVAEELSAGPPPLKRDVWYQKHMAHHMRDEMLGSWLDALDHAILIRHPSFVIKSYSQVTSDMTLAETGLPWQMRLLEHLQGTRPSPPPVIDADQLRRAPEPTLRALCYSLSLDWDPAMLHWPAGPHPQDGVWGSHWYANTWASTGFTIASGSSSEPPPCDAPFYEEALALYKQLSTHCLSI
jgi:hypothetical protein